MISVTSRSNLFAHTGDLHIGAGYAHGDEDAGGVNSRLRDFQASWVWSCKEMVEAGVQTAIIAGDVFHTAKPTPTELAAFVAGLEVLEEADISVLAIVGNHDQARSTGRAHALHVFKDRIIVIDRPEVIHHHGVWYACLPNINRAHVAAADPEFAALDIDAQNARIADLMLQTIRGLAAKAEQAAQGNPTVLVAHGTIAGSAVGAAATTAFFRDAVLPLSELRGLPFDYQAWAHLHRAQELTDTIRYCGSIDRIDFNEAGEDKGWWLVDLGDPGLGMPVITWRSSNPRSFVDLALDDPAEWERDVEPHLYTPDWIEGSIVRVSYTATPEVAKTVDHGAIRRALYAAGAVKVHGPFADITHDVTARDEDNPISEDTDVMTAWERYATLQGIEPTQYARLQGRMREACEVNQ